MHWAVCWGDSLDESLCGMVKGLCDYMKRTWLGWWRGSLEWFEGGSGLGSCSNGHEFHFELSDKFLVVGASHECWIRGIVGRGHGRLNHGIVVELRRLGLWLLNQGFLPDVDS